MGTVEHQSCNLIDTQLRGQVGGTLLWTSAPVFVDVEFPISVQVFESKTIYRKQFDARSRGISQCTPSLLSNLFVTWFGGFRPLDLCLNCTCPCHDEDRQKE